MSLLKWASKKYAYPKGWKKDPSKPESESKSKNDAYLIRSDLNSSKTQETVNLLSNDNLRDELNELLLQKFNGDCKIQNWDKSGFVVHCDKNRKECRDFIQFIADKFIKKGSADLVRLLGNTEFIGKRRKYNGTFRFTPIASIASRVAKLKLSPGVAFHLDTDGTWKPKPVPPNVIRDSTYSGTLTIYGYKSIVFETRDGESWAQRLDLSSKPKELKEPEPEEEEPEEEEPEEE